MRYKPVEMCTTLSSAFFYKPGERYKSVEKVLEQYAFTRKVNANYLLNVALAPDGSIPPQNEKVLRAVGKRLALEKKAHVKP
jgi:alpha-L-fucosidase